MTSAPLLNSPGIAPPPLTARFMRWGRWLVFLLLTGNVIVCHGCHSDEDNELCAPPPQREIRNPKQEIRMKPEDTNLKSKTVSRDDFGFGAGV